MSNSIKVSSLLLGAAALGLAGVAAAQNSAEAGKAPSTSGQNHWVPPGTPGSPIDGTIFHAQVLLDRAGFAPGVIDGKEGQSLTAAIKGFQEARGLKVTGELDRPTRVELLRERVPSTLMLRISAEDLRGRYVDAVPDSPADQAKIDWLGYRNSLEKLAEKFHTTPATMVALNKPGTVLRPGAVVRFPAVLPSSRSYEGLKTQDAQLMSDLNVSGEQPHGDHVVVDKSDGVLRVFDGERLIGQFPATMGSRHDPLPLGRWKITTFAYLPPFHYQPDLFWDVADSKEEQRIPPGPNGPVGVAWLDLTKDHYGIHGTAEPQTIGRAESHGCIRLSNWDVARLSRMIDPGVSAVFQA